LERALAALEAQVIAVPPLEKRHLLRGMRYISAAGETMLQDCESI
jgi:hypothetical protein